MPVTTIRCPGCLAEPVLIIALFPQHHPFMLRRRSLARPALCTCGPTVCQRCRPSPCPYIAGCPIAGRVILSHRPILRCSCCLSSLEPTERESGAALRGQQGIGAVAPTCESRFKAPGHTAQAGEAAPLPRRPGALTGARGQHRVIYFIHGPDRLLAREAALAIAAELDPDGSNTSLARWPGDVIRGRCVSSRRRLVLRLAANCHRHGPPGPRQPGFRQCRVNSATKNGPVEDGLSSSHLSRPCPSHTI